MPRVPPHFGLGLLACLAVPLLPAQEASLPPLTSNAAIRALTHQEAATARPVRVRGVVTLLPADALGKLTLDDGTGIWVSADEGSAMETVLSRAKVGDVLEITGRSNPGHFAPTITPESVTRVGWSELPAPRQLPFLSLASGIHDCQRVTLTGIVQAAEIISLTTRTELKLLVSTPTGPFTFVLYGRSSHLPAGLVDSEVSLTGVFLAYFNSRRQYLGVRVYSNDPDDLRIVRPPAVDAFDVPELALADVTSFSTNGIGLHRRRVRGTVTLSKPGHYLFIQDHPHALRINTRQTDALQPGDVVEATGFFQLEHHRAEMKEAVFRKVGGKAAPEPVEIARRQAIITKPWAPDPAAQDFDDRLVALRGRLVNVEIKQGGPVRLNLESDGGLVPAEFTSPVDANFIAALRPGSELRVSGVCALTYSESLPVVNWPTPIALRLLLRGPADVLVVRAAPWWTPFRLWTALGATAVVLLIALAWVVLLRRQVARRSEQLAEEMRARRDASVEFESTLRERNRLAADLHDTTEQSLTGLALQLEAADALRHRAPDRSLQHLGLARQLLDRSREDLRRSIWNLRANPLERNTLAEALQEVAADRSTGLAVQIAVESEGPQRALPDFVAGNLLLLAQEAITNALKHAKPGRIELFLRFFERTLILVVRDDGAGFDPATAEGPKDGHFGLQGMRERIKRLGGRLEIQSALGRGTVITAEVPQ